MTGYSPILELGDDPLTPREKVAEIVRDGMSRLAASQAGARPVVSASKEADRVTDAILTALASGSGDHAELARSVGKAIDANIHRTSRLYSVRTGERRYGVGGQAAATDAVMAVVSPLLAENAALRAAVEIRDGHINRLIDQATEAERKLAEAVGRQLPDISTDGPNEIDDHRYWLARQLLDSKLTADEAYSIVRHFPGISKEAERG